MLLALLACTPNVQAPEDSLDTSLPTPSDTSAPTVTPPIASDPEGLDPLDDLSGLADLSCASHTMCAPDPDSWLGDTCCAFGDPIDDLFSEWGFIEGVDLEADGRVVAACSGFGALLGTADDDGEIDVIDLGVNRCQRAALGPVAPDGSRTVYFAHHGFDTFLQTPQIWAYRYNADRSVEPVGSVREKGVQYEGMAVVGDHLWVATHAGGLRVYTLDAKGSPSHVTTLGGFGNASKIAVDQPFAYVIDEGSVVVLDASDPSAPKRVSEVATSGRPRDVELDDTYVYVALGGEGLEVFRRNGAALTQHRLLDLDGSIQAVSVHGPYVSVAAWDHVALLERDGFDRIGGQRLKDPFEETFGVAMTDDFLFALEWYGLHTLRIHQGLVAPEVSVDKEFLPFAATRKGSGTFRLTNDGPLNALVGSVRDNKAAFVTSHEGGRLRPGESLTVRVDYTPPVDDPATAPQVMAYTNDPDLTEDPVVVGLSALDSNRIDVGESLTEAFAFLDPTGNDDLDNLRGQVTVLAYFALF